MTDHIKVYGVKPRIQYTANGTSTVFEFPFVIFKASDIDVYLNEVKQSDTTSTVAGVRNSDGGTVTFATAPANGTVVSLIRNMSIERTSDFQEGGALRADVLNDELEYQIACQQQIAENLNRSMVLPPYAVDNNLDLTLPTPDAGKAIVWNAAGTNLENSTVSVNALESTLNGYKTSAETAAATATTKAGIATDAASTATTKAGEATTQAGIATTKAAEVAGALSGKADKNLSNVAEADARQLVGNRIWISSEYDLSYTANVVVSHNLGLTDVTKALAIPYLRFTTATAGYDVDDIISNFGLLGLFYSPGGSFCAGTDYSSFLNLSENSVVIPKLITDIGLIVYHKSTGVINQINMSNVKIFVKIIY